MDSDSNTPWQYKPSGSSAPPEEGVEAPSVSSEPPEDAGNSESVSWEAAEFIDHEQSSGWYVMLFLATALASVVVYFVTKDYFAVGTFIVLGIIVGFLAAHKPRQIKYELSPQNMRIGEKVYTYNQFKSFSVGHEGTLSSINLMPLKRFMPPISLYFDPKDEDKIVDAMGNHLPYQEHKVDLTDRLARRLRF